MTVNTPTSGTWSSQAGLIILLTVLWASARKKSKSSSTWKITEIVSLLLAVFLLSIGFYTRMWFVHPLGFIISLIGCIWIFLHSKKENGKAKD